MNPIPLVILQYWDYQYTQIEGFLKHLGPCIIAIRQTVEEKKQGSGVRGYRIINQADMTVGTEYLNEKELLNKFPFDYSYVLYTGKPYSGIDKLAAGTKKGVVAYIGHSLICSRYDSSLVLPETPRSVGFAPKCWIGFEAFKKESEKRPLGRFIPVDTLPLAIASLEQKPRVEVQDHIGLIFGEKSAFRTYRKMAKQLIQDRSDITLAKVKFHPLTDMTDPDVVAIVEDEDFMILPTDSNKFDFTDSCKYLVGGCSSLLIEAVLRNKYYERGQHISKFKEKRGIDLNMPEDTVDPTWTGEVPHEHMVQVNLDIETQYLQCIDLIESLYYDESEKIVKTNMVDTLIAKDLLEFL
ncbi:hypothetical protein [Vibrio phage Va2]|nr:hypothetical protein [Vibrio phage Va2]